MFIHIFFLTVKVSRGTDYDEGYIMTDQQTQTLTTCGCYEKAPIYGCSWNDDVLCVKKFNYKLNDIKEREAVAKIELSNPIHIPEGEDRVVLR